MQLSLSPLGACFCITIRVRALRGRYTPSLTSIGISAGSSTAQHEVSFGKLERG